MFPWMARGPSHRLWLQGTGATTGGSACLGRTGDSGTLNILGPLYWSHDVTEFKVILRRSLACKIAERYDAWTA